MGIRGRGAVAHPRTQHGAGADAVFVGVPPAVVVPFARVESEMQLGDRVFAQNLAERQRKQGIMLLYWVLLYAHNNE